MDKEFLLRLNECYKTIKTQLLLNDTVRKLLYYDKIDDTTQAPPISLVSDYIFLQPVVDIDTTEPFNKKNYITITMPESQITNNKMSYIIRIIVMCDKTSWIINDSIRPLLLSQEIINILDNKKLQLSGPIYFNSIVETTTNKDVIGYSLLFSTEDGISNDKK